MEKISKSNQFCLDVLKLGVPDVKALANTVMSLASDTSAHSPVELSNGPLFHYQNTSVSKSIAKLAKTDEARKSVLKDIQHLCNLNVSRQMLDQPFLHVQTDATSVPHPHSPTLENRTYVYMPNNVIPGNKPLSTGYTVSSVNIGEAQSSWSLPLSMRRVGPEEAPIACAVGQLDELFDHSRTLPLKDGQMVLNDADTGYAHPSFVAPLWRHDGMVNIVRHRSGSKVWEPAPEGHTGGAPRIYAERPLYLRKATQTATFRRQGKTGSKKQPALGELPPDDDIELGETTKTGRNLLVRIRRWNDKMWRTKQGHNMHDKPFDVLCFEVRDAKNGRPVFEPLWAGMHGSRKSEVPTRKAYESYRHRYDIEPSFRFEKQGLMLGAYQPSDVAHFDNWLLAVMLSFWLLFTASDEVEHVPKKWQQYPLGETERKRQQAKRFTPAQTQKAAQTLFLTFDQAPFLPRNCKKGKGRKKGQKQPPKNRFQVIKKRKKKA